MSKKTAKKQTAIESAPVESSTENGASKQESIVVDLKKAYEEVRSAKEFPLDVELKVDDVVISLHSALETQFMLNAPLVPCVVSRKKILNSFCIGNKITPKDSTRNNKTENKTVSTYGVVPEFERQFEVDGDTYRLLSFLKYKIFKAENFVAVKHGLNLIVFDTKRFEEFKVGKLHQDMEFVYYS